MVPEYRARGSTRELSRLNDRLPAYKRVTGYILRHDDFPRTASLKIKRNVLGRQIANQLNARHGSLLSRNLAIVKAGSGLVREDGQCGACTFARRRH